MPPATAKPTSRRGRRDKTEVSCLIKYLVFGFNVVFWLIGLGTCAIGLWAWLEKDTFDNLSKITNIALDPAFVLVLVGGVTFVIGFLGCIGALRENTLLLLIFAVLLGIILFAELAVGILGFVYKDWVKGQIKEGFETYIVSYREDIDLQNLVDWVQEKWLHCCGIDGIDDWNKNKYFNCSSPSREACGVPFSCCKFQMDEIKNKQCGYDVRKDAGSASEIVYTQGCVSAGEDWLQENLVVVAGVAVGLAVTQILGICFAQNLRADIFAQKAKWRY